MARGTIDEILLVIQIFVWMQNFNGIRVILSYYFEVTMRLKTCT